MSTKAAAASIKHAGLQQPGLHAFLVAALALACALVVSTKQINYTYPLEALLKTIIKDNSIIEDHLYKVRL